MAEGLDSVCIIDSPNPSPTDAKRAPFDFSNSQMVRSITITNTSESIEITQSNHCKILIVIIDFDRLDFI